MTPYLNNRARNLMRVRILLSVNKLYCVLIIVLISFSYLLNINYQTNYIYRVNIDAKLKFKVMMSLKIHLTRDDVEKYSSLEFREQANKYLNSVKNAIYIDSYYLPAATREIYKQLRSEIIQVIDESLKVTEVEPAKFQLNEFYYVV